MKASSTSTAPKPPVEISPEEIYEILEKVSAGQIQAIPQLNVNSQAIIVLFHQTLSTSHYVDQSTQGRIDHLKRIYPSCVITHKWIEQIGNLISNREEVLEEVLSQMANVYKAQKK